MRRSKMKALGILAAALAFPGLAAKASEDPAARRTTFALEFSRANVAQVANGAEVTPTIKPADLKGTLVM